MGVAFAVDEQGRGIRESGQDLQSLRTQNEKRRRKCLRQRPISGDDRCASWHQLVSE